MTDNIDGLKYICLTRELSNWIDMLKSEGQISHAQDLIRVGVVLGLTFDECEVDEKLKESINRAQGDRNYNSGELDVNGYLSFLIRKFGGEDSEKPYRRMQALANLGVQSIRDKFYDEVIKWDEIEAEIKR